MRPLPAVGPAEATVGRRRPGGWARPVVRRVPTPSGTSRAILGVPSWDHPRPVARRADRRRQARQRPAGSGWTPDPKQPGGAEVAPVARVAPVVPVAHRAREDRVAAARPGRPGAADGRQARTPRTSRAVGRVTPAAGRRRPAAGRRRRAVVAGVSPTRVIHAAATRGSDTGSPERAVPGGRTEWDPTVHRRPSVVLRAAPGHSRRHARNRSPVGA
jgi:hypothetical protein